MDNREWQTPPPGGNTFEVEEILPGGRAIVDLAAYKQAMDLNYTIMQALVRARIERAGSFHEALERLLDDDTATLDFEARRKKHGAPRQVGFLGSPASIRREMANLYRESYAEGLEGSRYFTRLMYMLDCLLRGAQAEAKTQQQSGRKGKKAYEAGTE